jgi:DNA-binding transcriptional LysR family regulator
MIFLWRDELMVNFRQLTTFVTVAELGSFTKAARALYMTQPAISWQIKSLEEDLELTLLERQDRNITLTEAGEIFYKEARRLTNLYDNLLAQMEQYKSLEKGRLCLGASNIPGEYLLPAYIGRFKEVYPGAEISLAIADTGAIVDRLLEAEIQLGVIGAKVEEAKLWLTPLARDELILISSPDLLPAEKKKLTMEELARQKFVMREAASGTRMVIKKELAKHKLDLEELDLAMELGSTQAIITAVAAGLGMSWVSRWAAASYLSLGQVREIEVEGLKIQRDLYLAYHRQRTLSPLARAFLDFLSVEYEGS